MTKSVAAVTAEGKVFCAGGISGKPSLNAAGEELWGRC